MSLANFTERVKTIVRANTISDAKVKFELDEGVVHVDATQQPNIVNNEDKEADCVIKMSLENANKLLDGELNVMSAVMFGKIKIKGDMGVAMKVAQMVTK